MVLGAGGQLGSEWLRGLRRSGHHAIAVYRNELDAGLEDRSLIQQQLCNLLDQWQPSLVVNALAYTAVDRAEAEPELAHQVNAWFPGLLGREASGVPVVHYSSDYVFDGTKLEPYNEGDEPLPLSVYGTTKLQGERALLHSNALALVFRTSWVVGATGHNFARTMLRLACEREKLQVVADQIGVPTPAPFLAGQLLRLLPPPQPLGAGKPTLGPEFPRGLFHLVPSGQTSWHAYAQWLIAHASEDPHWGALRRAGPEDVAAIRSSQYPSIARRPANSLLSTEKWRRLVGMDRLEAWTDALLPVLNEMLQNAQTHRLRNSRISELDSDHRTD